MTEPSRRSRRRVRPADDGSRAARDIAGAGGSQLGVDRAMRARDVNRPDPDELAAAERDVVLVRRNWRPR